MADEDNEEGKWWEDLKEYVMTFARGIEFAITPHTVFMLVLTILATLICAKGILDFSFDTSMSIVAVGTVFPLVFSVQASFQRRERALSELASLKSTIFSIYLMFKTWDKTLDGKPAGEVQELFNKLIEDIIGYLRSVPHAESVASAHVVYDGFSTLAAKMNEFGPVAGYAKPGEGGMSRLQQYLRDVMNHFENVRAVRDTETPVGLRLFCFALIHFSPILLAPYWNNFCKAQNATELPANYGCESGYFVGCFFVLINITLYRVQTELEDPFDGNGRDDIKWNRWRAQLDQMDAYGPEGPLRRRQRQAEIDRYQEGSTPGQPSKAL